MKPSYLSVLIAAGAFAASTVYLAGQLKEERLRADQVLAQSQALQARIAELEKLRAVMAVPPVLPDASATDATEAPMIAGAAAPGMEAVVEMEGASSPKVRRARVVPRPEESAAFLKMMRGQMRMQNRRIYSDLGSQLGLTREDTNRLIDLLTDQQVDLMGGRMRDPDAVPLDAAELQQKQTHEVAALIGYDKVEQFKAYQESLPARQEVATIARQLEGADLQLEEPQREKLVAALTEERRRIPAPEYVPGSSTEEHMKAVNAWQEDYQLRTGSRVRSILNNEQLGTYEAYQQWSREMRAQFESHRVIRGKDGSEGNVVMAEPVDPVN